MTNKQLKQSLINRLNATNKIIESLKGTEKDYQFKTQRDKQRHLNQQIGFAEGLKIALTDLDYKITKKINIC